MNKYKIVITEGEKEIKSFVLDREYDDMEQASREAENIATKECGENQDWSLIKLITREEAIDELIKDDFSNHEEDHTYLYNTLRDGYKGYKNCSNEELEAEYNERMPEVTEIIK